MKVTQLLVMSLFLMSAKMTWADAQRSLNFDLNVVDDSHFEANCTAKFQSLQAGLEKTGYSSQDRQQLQLIAQKMIIRDTREIETCTLDSSGRHCVNIPQYFRVCKAKLLSSSQTLGFEAFDQTFKRSRADVCQAQLTRDENTSKIAYSEISQAQGLWGTPTCALHELRITKF